MSEREFEEFLQREGRDYNAPPANVPRDEMWQAITAARRTAPRGGGTPDITPAPRSPWRARAPWIGMAATLVIGVAIGRFALVQRAAPLHTTATVTAAETTTAAPGTTAAPAAPSATEAPATTNRLAAGAPSSTRGANSRVTPADLEATAQHLARAEALLVAYTATNNADTIATQQFGRWAKDVLLNTRVLMDSPAGRDPERRALLHDLESVLVQLVQRSPAAGAAEERAQIQRSLDRTHVVPRLRQTSTVSLTSGT